jgi:hypothetical protein
MEDTYSYHFLQKTITKEKGPHTCSGPYKLLCYGYAKHMEISITAGSSSQYELVAHTSCHSHGWHLASVPNGHLNKRSWEGFVNREWCGKPTLAWRPRAPRKAGQPRLHSSLRCLPPEQVIAADGKTSEWRKHRHIPLPGTPAEGG